MKRLVIKIGGSLAVDEQKLSDFVKAVSHLPEKGYRVAVVHGGGKEINANISLLNEEPTFIDGLRVTTPNIMNMVEMTLSGSVNKKLVRLFQKEGALAVGISGVDGGLFQAARRKGKVDLGQVGEIYEVRPKLVECLWESSFIPVVSPVSFGEGLSWNVNADTAASELAVSLLADQFILVSDVPGVLDGEKNRLAELSESSAEKLIEEGVISGGMIPKVRESFKSIARGLGSIHIVGWKDADSFEGQVEGVLNYGTILR